MARITVEDCLHSVPNRFELVLLATKRARQLDSGEVEPTLDWENDKSTVVALREIAAGTFTGEEPQDEEQQGNFYNRLNSVDTSGSDYLLASTPAASQFNTFEPDTTEQAEMVETNISFDSVDATTTEGSENHLDVKQDADLDADTDLDKEQSDQQS